MPHSPACRAARDDINVLPAAFQAPRVKHLPGLSQAGLVMAACCLAGLAVPARAEDVTYDTPSKQPVPRWAMLKDDEVYARNGPSKDNATIWTYRVAQLPVQIISETRDWRLICDPDGNTAWVSKIMLRAQHTVMSPFTQKLELRASPNANAPVRAVLRPKSLAQMVKCKDDWCKLKVDGVTGWAPSQSLWGTQKTQACQRPNPLASR